MRIQSRFGTFSKIACSLGITCKAVWLLQVDVSSAQLAHDQAAIDYCFKPALEYKAAGLSASQAVLKILTTLREVADSAQVEVVSLLPVLTLCCFGLQLAVDCSHTIPLPINKCR